MTQREQRRGRLAHYGRSRWDASDSEKHQLCRQIQQEFKSLGLSKAKMFDKWAGKLGCKPATVRNMWRDRAEFAKRHAALTATEVARGHVTGKPIGRPAKYRSKAATLCQKKRNPGLRGYLGKTDYLRDEREAVAAWAHQEEQHGHCLGRQDLFVQFRALVEHKKTVLTAFKASLAEKNEELPEFDQKAFGKPSLRPRLDWLLGPRIVALVTKRP